MFFARCKHHWIETRRHSRQPASEFSWGGGFTDQGVEDALFGWTMIELRCEQCGDVKAVKIRYTGE
jgi:hypothetical protein